VERRERAAPRSERGQTLIIVAVALVGLLALAGLAIDGGNLVVQRRRAPNAADAAALAGTRLIAAAMQTCGPIDQPALDAGIARTVNEYAEQNGVSDTNGVAGDEVNDNVAAWYVGPDENRLGQVGEVGALPQGASGVEVALQDRARTYFLLIVGIDTIPSSAQAMAMTGRVLQFPTDAGLIPVAIPLQVVEHLMEEGNPAWEMHDISDGEFCYTPVGATEAECVEDPVAPHNAQRGWLNLNHIFNSAYLTATNPLNRTFERNVGTHGCKDPPDLPGLKGYASGECNYRYPVYGGEPWTLGGDFIHGSPGSKSSALKELYEGYAGEYAYAPVFDRVYLREEMVGLFDPQADSPEGYKNGGGFSSAGGGEQHAYYYHVVGYVKATIDETADKKILNGTFVKAKIAAIDINVRGYDGSCTLMLYGVTLWR
jgi:Flp pilus assembly protein TadG